MKENNLGRIKIQRPISKASILIIMIILLSLIFFTKIKIEPFIMSGFIMFCIFCVVGINIMIKFIKIILRKLGNKKIIEKYEPKRLECIYNAFEKLFLIFSPIGLLFIIDNAFILLLPIIVFLVLVFLSIKNYSNSKKTMKINEEEV